MVHRLLAGPLQLTLWEYMEILLRHHWYFLLSAYKLVVMVIITIFEEGFAVYYRHDAMNLSTDH